MNQKIRIGVLMGGRSSEREVSFNSSRTIYDHIDDSMYEIVPFFENISGDLFILPWHFLHRGKISDFENRLHMEAKKVSFYDVKEMVDLLFLSLHGEYGEDGKIQGLLEYLNIPYIGSSLYANIITSDKYKHEKMLKSNQIKTTNSVLINIQDIKNNKVQYKIEELEKKFTYPLVVKPINLGSSIGVSISNNRIELLKNIEEFCNLFPNQSFLIQEKIEGKEFSVILIEKDNNWIVFDETEIIAKSDNYIFNYQDKYMPGSCIKKMPSSFSECAKQNIKHIVKRIAVLLEASSILRIDGFVLQNDEIVILETNTFPGMAPSSFTFLQAAYSNLSHSKLIHLLIEEGLKKYNIKNAFIEINSKDNEKKIKIGVLFGGSSNEKEISLESGRNVCYKLEKNKYEIVPLFMHHNNNIHAIPYFLLAKNSTSEIGQELKDSRKISLEQLKDKVEFIFLALHGGIGENGFLQKQLDELGIKYNGSRSASSSLCMNKYLSYLKIKEASILVPNYLFYKFNDQDLEDSINLHNLIFPLVVKPYDDGCSVGIEFCKNMEDVNKAINNLKLLNKDGCLIEEVQDFMELTVGVLGNKDIIILPPTYTPKKSDILSMTEKFLPGDGENITPAPLKKEEIIFIQNQIKKCYEALGCQGYARIDCFYDKVNQKFIFLECNTLPALTPATCLFHQAAEINMTPYDLLNKIIELGLNHN